MIVVVEGDLLESKEDVIGHSVNCMGKMNSGLAKQIREMYPVVYEEYLSVVNDHMSGEDNRNSLLGKVQGVMVDNRIVCNIFGQYSYGYDERQYTDTEALFRGLVSLKTVAKNNSLSVGLPYLLGSDRGGADWNEVENLIDTAFNDYRVTLYKYNKE